MNTAIKRSLLLAAGLLAPCAQSAWADQYRSEVRVLEEAPPPQQQKQDAAQLLKQTTDPYARALLLRELAGKAAKASDYKQAAKYLEHALGQKALSAEAEAAMRDDLTALQVASGDPKAVVRSLEPLLKRRRALAAGQLAALGAAYVNLKRYADAVPVLKRALAGTETPDENWLRALLAAHIGLGQDREAAAVVEQLLRVNPAVRDYWLQAAAFRLKAGDQPRAQALLEIAARQGFLTTPEDRLRLAALTAAIGAPFEAGSLLKNWLDSGEVPNNRANARTLAAYWLAARESRLATAAIESALAFGDDAELLTQLGQLQMRREAYGEAARAFERAVAQGARDGAVLMALAVSRYQQADIDAAIAAFRKAADYPAQRKLALEWDKYLQSGRAREQALTALAQRRQRGDEEIALSQQLLGETVSLAAPAGESAPVSGDPYTPVGAERAGNADGTIPAWSGGLRRADLPADFKPGQRLKDPYAGEKPVYTITAANMGEYAQRLSDGHKALLRRAPGYKMLVYPTHRSVAYPPAIYTATEANRERAKLAGADALIGARLGFPFPRPENGVEIMWNHRVRYRGDSVQVRSTQAVVSEDGEISNRLKQTERVYYRYANLKDPVDISKQNILLYYLTWFSRSGTGVDFLALAHETANSLEDARAIWVLPPGINRLFRIPPVGYDQPFPGSAGLSFIDMIDMYNGAFDRYVWKLTGKRELIVPYNGYRISDGRYTYAQLLTPGHFNTDVARYETHRVWVIEATERQGKNHSFGKRVFYVDEDSWNVVLVENYDHQGRLWRFQEGHLLALYDSQSANCLPVVTYDFKDGRYFINRLIAEDSPPEYNLPGLSSQDFLPSAVKNRYAR